MGWSPKSTSLDGLITERLSQPRGLILKDESQTYTDHDISNAVARLAETLKTNGIGRQHKVGVMCGQASAQPLAMLAVWALGAIYVPISMENTTARIDYLINDCQLDILLVSGIAKEITANVKRVDISILLKPQNSSSTTFSPCPMMTHEELSYICYTSGSTGKPKGVMITHGSVERLLRSTSEMFGWLSDHEVYMQNLDYSFDISIWNIQLWLLKRGTLISAAFGTNIAKLLALLQTYQPTVLCEAAPTYGLLLASKMMWHNRLTIRPPKAMFTVASYCLPQTASELLDIFPAGRLFNCYGPTETTVYCCWAEIKKESIMPDKPLSIGFVMPGNQAWLYDGNTVTAAADVPENTQAELCISGDHVCLGYWNAPQLNEEKFLKGPGGERLYRTGDLVSRFKDQFYYWGRMDDTVKLKGYRVNLGEIEHCIGACREVASCAVVLITDAATYQNELIACYLPKKGISLTAQDLSTKLTELCKTELSAYMRPNRFIALDSFPLTASGKINRASLKEKITAR